ncbi:hypothetical protein N9O57_00130 [bacterium]|nr:hypothetical protein [bacterium]
MRSQKLSSFAFAQQKNLLQFFQLFSKIAQGATTPAIYSAQGATAQGATTPAIYSTTRTTGPNSTLVNILF